MEYNSGSNLVNNLKLRALDLKLRGPITTLIGSTLYDKMLKLKSLSTTSFNPLSPKGSPFDK